MRNALITLALSLPFLAIQGCKKETTWWEKVQESNSGFVTAKLNGKDWTGQIVTGYYNSRQKFGISIGQYTGDVATGNLSINDIYFTKPANRIYDNITSGKKDSTMAYFFLTDDDVVFSSYLASKDSSVINTIYVDKYDNTTGVVNGRFHFTLHLKYGDVAVRNWPDTLKFTDGEFRLKIKKR